MRQRGGFTFLEVMLAVTILSVVMAGVINAFVGMRKAQGSAITTSELKAGGQVAMKRMFMELSQSRKLFANLTTDPVAKDIGREYYNLLADKAKKDRLATMPAGNVKIPRVNPTGGFGMVGVVSGTLDQTTVGNTLVFLQVAKNIQVATPGVTMTVGPKTLTLANDPFYISSYRFIAYYLAEQLLPAGVAPINGSRNYTLQLMRYQSAPYLERNEFEALTSKLALATDASTVYQDMVASHAIDGLWDSTAASAVDAFYRVDSAGAYVKVTNPAIARADDRYLVQTNLQGYALPLVAFNTSATFKVPDMTVPTFGKIDSAAPEIPYGFEVAIAGPSGARSVLLRLSLAARINAGMNLNGFPHQGVVKVFDL